VVLALVCPLPLASDIHRLHYRRHDPLTCSLKILIRVLFFVVLTSLLDTDHVALDYCINLRFQKSMAVIPEAT